MTIFSNVAKSFLIDAITAQIKRSIEKDTPPPKLFTYFLPERNKDLAYLKRACLHTLKNTISELPEEGNDLTFTRTLLFYLEDCKTQVEQAALNSNHAPGTTEALLEHLIKFIKLFHKKAISLMLTDEAHTDDAFAYFSTVIASYHAKRIVDHKTEVSFFQSTLENPSLTPIIAFQKNLDDIVNQTYMNARRNLEKQGQTDTAHYMQVKTELGLLCIEFLALKLDKMLSEYSHSLYASFLPYYLSDYLKHAQRLTQSQNTTLSFKEDIADDFTLYATSPDTDKMSPGVGTQPMG
jgi:hypothetical protein